MKDKPFNLFGKEYKSRLIVGTGKYKTPDIMVNALEASGTEIVTVALRRVNLEGDSKTLLDYIDTERYTLLPNTAGCYTADEAIRVARLSREMGIGDLVKIEVLGDQKTLLPDVEELLKATRVLVKENFIVMAYTNDDVITAKKLEDLGVAAVMPLGAPIGAGLGILNYHNIRLILEAVKAPVIVDAGVGTASDITRAMELGIDGVLLNTGIACASDPVMMACAMKKACEAGRFAYLAGRIPKKAYASASTPIKDF